jgi:hypothetical protein
MLSGEGWIGRENYLEAPNLCDLDGTTRVVEIEKNPLYLSYAQCFALQKERP